MILKKKRLSINDETKLEKEEKELNQLIDKFENDQKHLIAKQQKFKQNVDAVKRGVQQRHQQELAAFDKDVIRRYAPLKKWDIVLPQEADWVLYVGKGADKTDDLIEALDQQITARKKTYTTKDEVKTLFKDLGLVYLDDVVIDSSVKGDIDGRYTSYYDEKKQNLDMNTRKYNKLVEQHYRAPISVKWVSDKVGFGIFATKHIAQGELVQEYTGVLRVAHMKNGLIVDDTTYAWMYPPVGEYQNNLLTDSKYEGNEIRFVNHGNHPNVTKVNTLDKDGIFHVCYVAIQDIKAGEQILISYGIDYWATREFFEDL